MGVTYSAPRKAKFPHGGDIMRQDYWWCDVTYEYLKHAYDAIRHLKEYLHGEQPSRGVESYLKRIRQLCEDIIYEINKLVKEDGFDGRI